MHEAHGLRLFALQQNPALGVAPTSGAAWPFLKKRRCVLALYKQTAERQLSCFCVMLSASNSGIEFKMQPAFKSFVIQKAGLETMSVKDLSFYEITRWHRTAQAYLQWNLGLAYYASPAAQYHPKTLQTEPKIACTDADNFYARKAKTQSFSFVEFFNLGLILHFQVGLRTLAIGLLG